MTDAAKLGELRRRAFHLEQREHLRVAVLLDDIDTVAAIDERADLRRERIRAEPEVRGVEPFLVLQLIARLDDRPVRGAVRDQADAALAGHLDLGLRYERTGSL